MAKKGVYYDDVLRLYIEEGLSHKGIEERVPVSDKAQRIWKEEDRKNGIDWDVRRKQYLASRQSFHEEQYHFARELMEYVRQCFKDKVEPSQSYMYLLKDILGKVGKTKEYEQAVNAEAKESQGGEGLTEEKILEIRKKVLGI